MIALFLFDVLNDDFARSLRERDTRFVIDTAGAICRFLSGICSGELVDSEEHFLSVRIIQLCPYHQLPGDIPHSEASRDIDAFPGLSERDSRCIFHSVGTRSGELLNCSLLELRRFITPVHH